MESAFQHLRAIATAALLAALPLTAVQAVAAERPVPKSRRPAVAGKQERTRHLTREKRYKAGQTKVDFEAATILGEGKTPNGILVDGTQPASDHDFVRLRLRWHPEMVLSTAALGVDQLSTAAGDPMFDAPMSGIAP